MRTTFDESVASGVVISQNPSGGFEGTEGATAAIVVSKGPSRSTVPDVVGKSEEEARKLIEDADLVVDVTYFLNDGTAEVGEQSPAAGEKAVPGSTVEILVDAPEP